MRLGVLDVGSNTVHLLVVDAHRGGHPDPVGSVKEELRLAELLQPDGTLGRAGTDRLVSAVAAATTYADEQQVEDLLAFATSAVRDAADSGDVLDAVRRGTGVDLQVLPGEDEARLTFLAVRRWFGWSAGRILALDIGGGSLEIASGIDEEPDTALSLPLGAGRLARTFLSDGVPREEELEVLRTHVRATLEPQRGALLAAGAPDRVVATSKTFRTLARIAGAAPSSAGPRVRRRLTRAGAADVLDLVSGLPVAERAALPGVSPRRAGQLVAGAVVGYEALVALGVDEVDICPWALREGVVLRRLDWLAGT